VVEFRQRDSIHNIAWQIINYKYTHDMAEIDNDNNGAEFFNRHYKDFIFNGISISTAATCKK